jgi:8-amino-7-oxononanoate synthase
MNVKVMEKQAKREGSMDAALSGDLQALEVQGLRRRLRRIDRRAGMEVDVDGRKAIDFASNDYLGLASDARLRAALGSGAAETMGATASRNLSGNYSSHEQIERQIAELKRCPAALLLNCGYAANVGVIPALAGAGDVIYSDALNHASLIDGCRLARASARIFPHADLGTLADMLRSDHGRFRRRLIAVEGVYSMDGDVLPLLELADLADAHDAWIYLDDAHGGGVLGARGAGTLEHAGLSGRGHIVLGTLGKAYGLAGAFLAGSLTLRDYLINRCRSFVFSTGIPPAWCAALRVSLELATTEQWRRDRLFAHAARLRQGLRAHGRELPANLAGHIVPVVLGSARAVVRAGEQLLDRGLLVAAVRPPTVPDGTARLRISLSAAHTDDHIDRLVDALAHILPE